MEGNSRFMRLKEEFGHKYQRSLDKETLLEKEIEGYSLIFDENNLQLSNLSTEDAPLGSYSIPYSSTDIFLIRKFYRHFIVEGAHISELEPENDIWNSWIRDLLESFIEEFSEPFGQKYRYGLTRDLFEYLKWLKAYSKPKLKYPDKYYAWYHGILVRLGKEPPFPKNFVKKEIIAYGKNRYQTGEGFYKTMHSLDLTQSYKFLISMNKKDRANWKKAIIDISDNDADCINFLNKFPN